MAWFCRLLHFIARNGGEWGLGGPVLTVVNSGNSGGYGPPSPDTRRVLSTFIDFIDFIPPLRVISVSTPWHTVLPFAAC